MPIIPGVYAPGCSVAATASVTADRNAFLTAAAGRQLKGWALSLPVSGGNAHGRLVKGAVATSTTGTICTFELLTNDEFVMWLSEGGIDASDGVSIDWVAGPAGFDCTLFYIDVT